MKQQLTNKEKALITYELLQKRKELKEKQKEQLIKKYTIERSYFNKNKSSKNSYGKRYKDRH
jgi:hypothetical protein